MHPKTLAAPLIFLALVAATAAQAKDWGDTWMILTNDLGPDPVVRKVHEDIVVGASGRVDVRQIDGNVEVTAAGGDKVTLDYERKARSQQDFDCQEFHYQKDGDTLRIWVDRKRSNDCRVIHAIDKLVLAVPRGAEVDLQNVGDSVRVSGLEGMLRLGSIGDTAVLTDVQQLRADSIGDSLKLSVSRLGTEGIKISSVGDSVEMSLPDALDARMRIDSVGDEIRGPGLRLTSMEDGGLDTVLGKGGPLIYISSVGDSVVIRGGPEIQAPERRRHRHRHED